MAANVTDSMLLSKFSESSEEHIVKKALKAVESELFINLTLNSCNGRNGSTFSAASFELAPLTNIRLAFATRDVPNPEIKYKGVDMRHVVNEKLLSDFKKEGVKALENRPDTANVFLCLFEFLRDIEKHQKALQKMIKNGSGETVVMVALAHHLFAQLIPSKEYVVDHQSRQIPEVCTCGCKGKILKGNTELGSFFTWHGRVDILLNQTIAVSIFDDKKEEIGKGDGNKAEVKFIEPPAKKKRIEADERKSECEICVEVKGIERNKDLLTEEATLYQVLSECITNGFAQVNMNKDLLGILIPTFGCTAENICVSLYDFVNDILLQNAILMNIWSNPFDELDVSTIVTIWVFLNFTTLVSKI